MQDCQVDWARLSHAYGPATDVPQLIADCRNDVEAPWEFAGSLIHQGSLYSATPAASLC